MSKVLDILLQPIPDYTSARKLKKSYRSQTPNIDETRNYEQLVDIAQYGVAGQSYFSRPNRIYGVIDKLLPTIWVRQSVAERLSAINYELQRCEELTKLFGGKVEIFVEEGLRPAEIQRMLYEEIMPERIKKQHPNMSKEQRQIELDEYIAKPANGEDSPAPHSTGGAVDVSLRYANPELGFVLEAELPMSLRRIHTQHEAYPDYYEHMKSLTEKDKILQRNRRIIYWVMNGSLVLDGCGFQVNPTEWWHWCYGDLMWAVLSKAPEVLFDLPEENLILFAR